MNSNKIDDYIRDMPSLPVSVEKVLQICNTPNVNPSDLNQVIALDPVLTGRLLKLINSAYYGLNAHITSLAKAIIMLGINTVKNLALSSAILGTLPKNKEIKGIDLEGFWRHCLCVAVTSKLLAAKQGIDPRHHQEFFTAGLLHDIGKIPLNAVNAEEYMKAVVSANKESKPLIVAENDTLGTNHCITGEKIAKMWKLESTITDVIFWHHDIEGYTGGNLKILCTVAMANYFSLIYDVGFLGISKPQRLGHNVWEIVGLNEDVYDTLKDRVADEIEKAKIFLNI